MVDLNLQLWQAILGLLTVSGFSAGPWILATMAGRIVPLGTVNKLMDAANARNAGFEAGANARIAGLEAELVRERDRQAENVALALAERDHERDAVRIERARSDDSAKAVMQLSREYGETMLHLAAKATTPEPTT